MCCNRANIKGIGNMDEQQNIIIYRTADDKNYNVVLMQVANNLKSKKQMQRT